MLAAVLASVATISLLIAVMAPSFFTSSSRKKAMESEETGVDGKPFIDPKTIDERKFPPLTAPISEPIPPQYLPDLEKFSEEQKKLDNTNKKASSGTSDDVDEEFQKLIFKERASRLNIEKLHEEARRSFSQPKNVQKFAFSKEDDSDDKNAMDPLRKDKETLKQALQVTNEANDIFGFENWKKESKKQANKEDDLDSIINKNGYKELLKQLKEEKDDDSEASKNRNKESTTQSNKESKKIIQNFEDIFDDAIERNEHRVKDSTTQSNKEDKKIVQNFDDLVDDAIERHEQRDKIRRSIEESIERALQKEKGTGCTLPQLDPFAPEIMKFHEKRPKIQCWGQDWVKCYLSKCKVVPEMLKKVDDVVCEYHNVLYENDKRYNISKKAMVIKGKGVYVLKASDHVKINCSGTPKDPQILPTWQGIATGFRPVTQNTSPAGRKDTLNVLIFGFDSTSRLGFIRQMPKSYKFMKDELEAIFLTSYNIVGEGSKGNLFPMLTGKTELELPEARKSILKNSWVDHTAFIFHTLKLDGYRTAFFDDEPKSGTFQWTFNGFKQRPADHYLNDFYHEVDKIRKSPDRNKKLCVGDTPQYKLMMNITEQFFKLNGKKFCFTFISDISWMNFNELSSADDDFVKFLNKFKADGHLKNTLVFIMGDHGWRMNKELRETYQGKLEERLPLMAVLLPARLISERPEAAAALKANAQVLTTPHDIYATILDAVNLAEYWNDYRINGSDLTRGLSMLLPIPSDRSCSEAGIEPHWCACHHWSVVKKSEHIYQLLPKYLIEYLNELTESVRDKCEKLKLVSVLSIMQGKAQRRVLEFQGPLTDDGYEANFKDADCQVVVVVYQLQIIVSPGNITYDASVTYLRSKDQFLFNPRDISRVNTSDAQSECISDEFPHLTGFCSCKQKDDSGEYVFVHNRKRNSED